jgi:hypothetical protein
MEFRSYFLRLSRWDYSYFPPFVAHVSIGCAEAQVATQHQHRATAPLQMLPKVHSMPYVPSQLVINLTFFNVDLLYFTLSAPN